MIRIDGEEPKVGLWTGASLTGFGTNPHGDPVWRVVWAPSRYFLFGGKHVSHYGGTAIACEWVGYKWLPLYAGMEHYVLERWLSPGQYMTGEKDGTCTQEMWEQRHRDPETGLCSLGPYPSKGVYFGPMWEFTLGYPSFDAIEAAIHLIEAGDRYTKAEKLAAMVKAQEIEQEAGVQKVYEKIMEKMPVFDLDAGVSGQPARPKAEDLPQKLSAEDVHRMTGMPVGRNKLFVGGSPVKDKNVICTDV